MPYPGDPQHHHDHGAGDPGDVGIPAPRQAPDNRIENLPAITQDQPVWSYDQKRPRGGDRRWTGHVDRVSGPEADCQRSELADVIADLLRWAQTQQRQTQQTRHGGDNSDDAASPDKQRPAS